MPFRIVHERQFSKLDLTRIGQFCPQKGIWNDTRVYMTHIVYVNLWQVYWNFYKNCHNFIVITGIYNYWLAEFKQSVIVINIRNASESLSNGFFEMQV
jgi:hypothetical protein